MAGVPTSAYNERAALGGPTPAEAEEAYLVNVIIDLNAASSGTYGSPRVTKELCRHGYCVGP